MLKKVLSSAILLAAVNASAGENYFANEWDAKGLIAIEGAAGSADLSYRDTTTTPGTTILAVDETSAAASASVKLGGESKHYRLFLAGTYYQLDAPNTTASTAMSLGLQVDYLIRAGEHFNIFMGLNGGGIVSTFEDDSTGTTYSETNQNGYGGAQVGANIDLIDNLGIELGVRAKHVFSDNDTYTIDNMYEAYGSIVFKFTGEY